MSSQDLPVKNISPTKFFFDSFVYNTISLMESSMKFFSLRKHVASSFLALCALAPSLHAQAAKSNEDTDKLVQQLSQSPAFQKLIEQQIQQFIENEKTRRLAAQQKMQQGQIEKTRPVNPQTDHILGNPKATWSLVVYSDFECPYCKPHFTQITDNIEQLKALNVNVVYRHLPLGFHGDNAKKSAYASECVAQQAGSNGFYAFAKLWFNTSRLNGAGLEWGEDQLIQLAAQSGAKNTEQFKRCLTLPATETRVKQDFDNASEIQLTGTPSNVIINNMTRRGDIIPGGAPDLIARISSIIKK